MKILELVDVDAIINGALKHDSLVNEVACIIQPGTYGRSPHTFINKQVLTATAQPLIDLTHQALQSFPGLYQIKIHKAHLIGQGFVVINEKYLIRDSCWEFIAQGLPLPGLVNFADGRYGIDTAGARFIEGPVCTVKRPWWRNYGHWLFDSASWLALLPSCPLPNHITIAHGDYRGTSMDIVVSDTKALISPQYNYLLHPDEDIFEIQDLYYLSPAQIHSHIKNPIYISALKIALLKDCKRFPSPSRIYIERPMSDLRKMENAEEIERILAAYGFQKLRIENYSLQEQAVIFNQAECIAGVKGAALSNILFSKAGTKVIVFSPADWADLFFWDIATIVGMKYVEIFGKILNASGGSTSAFRIEPEHLEAAIAL